MRSIGFAVAALGLSLSLGFAGCASLRSEGEESLTVRNDDGRALSAVVTIEQKEGGFRVFGGSMALGPGGQKVYALAMRPGAHTVGVTTSTSIVESVEIEIPEAGDTAIEIVFRRGSASIITTSG